MTTDEIAELMIREVRALVSKSIADAVGPLRDEIRALGEKFADQEHDGSLGEKEYAALLSRIDSLPVPKDGTPGKDADIAMVDACVRSLLASNGKRSNNSPDLLDLTRYFLMADDT